MNMDLEAKIESYNYAQYQLQETTDSIEENARELQLAAGNLYEAQDRLEKRVVSIYRNGSVDMLDVLMDTSDINEFMSTVDMMAKLGEQDQNDLEQVQQYKGQVEEMQAQLQADQAQQAVLVEEISVEQAEIQAGLSERQAALAGLEDQIVSLQVQEEEARQRAFAESMARSTADESDGGGDSDLEESFGPAPEATAGGAVGIAQQYLGVPYVWGGASPSGFDCSGLVMYVYQQLGISLPHSAAAQYSAGTPIGYDEMAPGDLVFFGDGGISHVGIYIGGGSMIHAPFEGEVVQVAPVSGGGSFRGACRL